jgi:hypothetical protein
MTGIHRADDDDSDTGEGTRLEEDGGPASSPRSPPPPLPPSKKPAPRHAPSRGFGEPDKGFRKRTAPQLAQPEQAGKKAKSSGNPPAAPAPSTNTRGTRGSKKK